MKEHEFYFPIEAKYFPMHKIVKQPNARVFYVADSLGNITLTWIGIGPSLLASIGGFCNLIIEIGQAAKDHYDTLGIEQSEYNDSEMQEKKFQ